MEKASRENGTYTLDDHELCGGMLKALKDKDCKLLQSKFNDTKDCIGEKQQQQRRRQQQHPLTLLQQQRQ